MRTALLLSGGVDSIAIAYWKRPSIAITIDYGQRPAAGELRAAAAVVAELQIEHHTVKFDLNALGSGDLCGKQALAIAPVPEWWPFRNQLLITLAAMRGVGLGVSSIQIGSVKSDDCHHDGTYEFIQAMNSVLCLQEGQIGVEAPAIQLTTAELVRSSGVPLELLAWAHSCHVSEFACGVCRGCRKHYETYNELQMAPY